MHGRLSICAKRSFYTLFIILIFRIGSAIAVPFVDTGALADAISLAAATAKENNTANFMDFLSMMSGGGFSDASIFALSITPYINASIIIQLLTVALPPLERMAKDGEAGRKKLGQITRYVTVGLGLMLGIAYYFMVRNKYNALVPEAESGFGMWFAAIVMVLVFTAGSALMMWLGEQINEKGIGNGISILLFAGILSRIPSGINTLWDWFYDGGILMLSQDSSVGDQEHHPRAHRAGDFPGHDRVHRVHDRRRAAHPGTVCQTGCRPEDVRRPEHLYPHQGQHVGRHAHHPGLFHRLPARDHRELLQGAGGGFWKMFLSWFRQDSWVYIVLYFLLIIGFAFFYVTIQYNPLEMSNNLRKNSGAIPGYRPGKPTTDYIKRVIHKVCLVGALFLGIVALFPSLFGKFSGFYGLTLGGTSIMIVVGVALETTQQIESQMMMRHYKGFLE